MNTNVAERGWFDTLKDRLNLDGLMQKLKLSKDKLIEIGIYLGIGFLTGFLIRRFSKYIIVFLLFIAGIVVLHQLNVIKIVVDWDKFQEVFGIQVVQPAEGGLFATYWSWIKTNFLVVISFLIGFSVGLKVG